MKTVRKRENLGTKSEYDFSRGIRGKYAKAYANGTNVVVLDPEVAKVFHDSHSVNVALRSLLSIIKMCSHTLAR